MKFRFSVMFVTIAGLCSQSFAQEPKTTAEPATASEIIVWDVSAATPTFRTSCELHGVPKVKKGESNKARTDALPDSLNAALVKFAPINVALSVDGNKVAYGNSAGLIYIYDTNTGNQIRLQTGRGKITFRDDNSVAASGTQPQEYTPTLGPIHEPRLAVAGNFAVSEHECHLHVVDIKSRKTLSSLPAIDSLRSTAVSRDGKKVAVAEKSRLRVWSLAN